MNMNMKFKKLENEREEHIHTIPPESARPACIACHCRPALATLGLEAIALDRRDARNMTGCVERCVEVVIVVFYARAW